VAEYILESRTRSGAYLATLPFRNLQGEWFLSKPCQIRWEMPYLDANITSASFYPGKTEVWLWRNGVKVLVGPVWDANPNSGTKSMSCSAESIDSYLDLRRVVATSSFIATSRANIAWSLINASQALTDGALGITQGSVAVTPVITVEFKAAEGRIIRDIIDDFASESDGWEWNIDTNRAFNTYVRTATASRVRLEYGGAVRSYALQVMGKWEANDILVTGYQGALSQPTIDTAKRTEYGLRHLVESASSLKTQTQLNSYAQQLLKQHRDVRYVPQLVVNSTLVNPFEGDITYMQTAPVVIDDGWVQVNQTMQCVGWQLSLGKHGNESFNLYMQDTREV